MKAPTDKRNDIIQVVITTACSLFSCSNCTQLLPFRKDARHMSVECFREAMRSLRDWPGIVGIFGGNPCSHPKFPELMEVLCAEIPGQEHRGLWTNDVLAHGALCREVFYPHGRFNLNAHADPKAAERIDQHLPRRLIEASRSKPAWHGALLVDRRDYGVGDEQWMQLRERCDINLHWSAAILERDGRAHAYFCEVAGAIDGVRGENHGVPVEPGWWRWKMPRFEGQVRQCCDRGCGVPLRLKGHLDRDDVYDVSPSWARELGDRGKRYVQVETHEKLPADRSQELTDYMELRTR